jgi:hypothetical protein
VLVVTNSWPAELTDNAHRDRKCPLCSVATSNPVLLPTDDRIVVAHAGDFVTVLVRPEENEVMVAPADHVGTLGLLSPPRLAQFLAALRRVALVVDPERGRVTAGRAEGFLGANGHICVRVAPDPPDGEPILLDEATDLAGRLSRSMLS